MNQELMQTMLDRIYKLSDQQAELLAKQAEMAAEQRHTAESVEEIKQDLAEVKAVQAAHSDDIRAVRDVLAQSKPIAATVKAFMFEHPIIAVILGLMGANIVLVSLGLPLIDIKTAWNMLVNGN